MGSGISNIAFAPAYHPRMNAQAVFLEIVFPGKTFAAYVAKMRFGTRVRRQVTLHFRSLRECSTTHGTSKDIRSLDVSDQSLRLGQR